jgi:flagellar protein FliO/FliZ
MKATNFAPLLWLMLVLVLIPATLLLLKRSGWAARLAGGSPKGEQMLQLRESLTIGPNQRVVAIEVGEGAERRCLLLGVTPQQITTLHLLDAPPELTAPHGDSADTSQPPFEVMLAKVRAAARTKSGGAA